MPMCDTVHGGTMEENWVKASMCTIKQHFAINYTHGCTLLQRQCSMRIKLWYILTHLLLPLQHQVFIGKSPA